MDFCSNIWLSVIGCGIVGIVFELSALNGRIDKWFKCKCPVTVEENKKEGG